MNSSNKHVCEIERARERERDFSSNLKPENNATGAKSEVSYQTVLVVHIPSSCFGQPHTLKKHSLIQYELKGS